MKIELCEGYQEKAHSTSKNTVIFGSKLLYPFFGLCGESGELLEKEIAQPTLQLNKSGDSKYKAEMQKEAGDVMWYIAEICTQMGTSIERLPIHDIPENDLPINLLSRLTICASKLMEKMKKMFRDGDVTSDSAIINDDVKKIVIMTILGEMKCILDVFCKCYLESNMVEVTQMNIDKLFSRKERGVISGSGDSR